MSRQIATVRVPATSANLGPGFDCLGLALDLWAEVTLTISPQPTPPPADPAQRMVITAARRLFQHIDQPPPAGLAATWDEGVPLARGLGASAVLRAAGLVAANALCGHPLDGEQLLALGADLEGHADNIAPALFGGLQVVARNSDAVLHVSVPLPPGLKAVLFIPRLHMPTQKSRQLLPKTLSRADAIYTVSRAALLVGALAAGRLDLLDAATQDRLHQPARSQLFPAMYNLFEAARAAGARCAYLSGGGSTICALATDHEERIAAAMAAKARRLGVTGKTIITVPTHRGAEIIDQPEANPPLAGEC